MQALLDTGNLAYDFIARRVVDKNKLQKFIVESSTITICSGLDNQCYEISKSIALSVECKLGNGCIALHYSVYVFTTFLFLRGLVQELSGSQPVLTSAQFLWETWASNSGPYVYMPLVLPTQPREKRKNGNPRTRHEITIFSGTASNS